MKLSCYLLAAVAAKGNKPEGEKPEIDLAGLDPISGDDGKWTQCTGLVEVANGKVICKKDLCMVMCMDGFGLEGNDKTKCRKDENGDLNFNKVLGECNACPEEGCPEWEKPEKPEGEDGEKPSGDKPTGDKPTGDKPTGDDADVAGCKDIKLGEAFLVDGNNEAASITCADGSAVNGKKDSLQLVCKCKKGKCKWNNGKKDLSGKDMLKWFCGEADADAEKPTGDKPTGDKPTGDKPTGDKPTGDKPTGDAEKPVGCKEISKLADGLDVAMAGEGKEQTATVTCSDGSAVNGKKDQLDLSCQCKKGKCKWSNGKKTLSGKDMAKWFCGEAAADAEKPDKPTDAEKPVGCKEITKLADGLDVAMAGEGKDQTATVTCADGSAVNGKKDQLDLNCECKKGKCKWSNGKKTLAGKDMAKWFCGEAAADAEKPDKPTDAEKPTGCKDFSDKLAEGLDAAMAGEGEEQTAVVTCAAGLVNGKKDQLDLSCKCKKGKCKWSNGKKTLAGKDMAKWFCGEAAVAE